MPPSYQYLTASPGLGIAKLNFTSPYGTLHAQIEFGYKDTNLVPNAATAGNVIRNNWAAGMLGFLANSCTFDQVETTCWTGTQLEQAVTSATPTAGTGSNPPLPPAACVVLKKLTGQIGKQNRGRVYLPYFPDSLVPNIDSLSTTEANAVTAAAETFRTAIAGSGNNIDLYIIRKTSNPALNHSVAVTGLLCESLLGTQRRRQRKAAHR